MQAEYRKAVSPTLGFIVSAQTQPYPLTFHLTLEHVTVVAGWFVQSTDQHKLYIATRHIVETRHTTSDG